MKFEKPRQSPEHFKKFFSDLCEEISGKFRTLSED
jgi:hypothetical protein